MSLIQISILAVIQGIAELLPVSSSAHVIVAEKLMGLQPSSPEMTMLLVMLHTGTMFAVLVYFWKKWKASFFQTGKMAGNFLVQVLVATVATGVVGVFLQKIIEKIILRHVLHAEIEMIFDSLTLIACALACVGILIILADRRAGKSSGNAELTPRSSLWIGALQGICLPFRGFSRSGATISTGLLLGLARMKAEEFSFALAVVLTPPVIAREAWRLLKNQAQTGVTTGPGLLSLFFPSLLGMVLSFTAGLLALAWLSRWLEQGRWKFFGYYCLAAAVAVGTLGWCGF